MEKDQNTLNKSVLLNENCVNRSFLYSTPLKGSTFRNRHINTDQKPNQQYGMKRQLHLIQIPQKPQQSSDEIYDEFEMDSKLIHQTDIK